MTVHFRLLLEKSVNNLSSQLLGRKKQCVLLFLTIAETAWVASKLWSDSKHETDHLPGVLVTQTKPAIVNLDLWLVLEMCFGSPFPTTKTPFTKSFLCGTKCLVKGWAIYFLAACHIASHSVSLRVSGGERRASFTLAAITHVHCVCVCVIA